MLVLKPTNFPSTGLRSQSTGAGSCDPCELATQECRLTALHPVNVVYERMNDNDFEKVDNH